MAIVYLWFLMIEIYSELHQIVCQLEMIYMYIYVLVCTYVYVFLRILYEWFCTYVADNLRNLFILP